MLHSAFCILKIRVHLCPSVVKIAAVRPILEISNLKIVRDGITILDGVNWRAERGQHWVILGANGSGKTSLLSALTGYLMPTAGEIFLLGKNYGKSDWRELRKKVGLVGSAVRQMMADDEPALETVASGKSAMIGFWGTLSPPAKAAPRKFSGKSKAPIWRDVPGACSRKANGSAF